VDYAHRETTRSRSRSLWPPQCAVTVPLCCGCWEPDISAVIVRASRTRDEPAQATAVTLWLAPGWSATPASAVHQPEVGDGKAVRAGQARAKGIEAVVLEAGQDLAALAGEAAAAGAAALYTRCRAGRSRRSGSSHDHLPEFAGGRTSPPVTVIPGRAAASYHSCAN
jgi:hypothetical protein